MRTSPSRNRQRGTSLVDVMATLAVIVVSLGGLAMSVLQTQRSSSEMRRRDMERAQAMKLAERLMGLPWGSPSDPQPSDAVVAALLDDDSSTGLAPGLTFLSLRTPVNDAGWRFSIAGFEGGGLWEIEVNHDLDGDGVLTGVRATGVPTAGDELPAGDGTSVVPLLSEGRDDLFRVEILHDGRSAARFLRAAPSDGS